MIVCMRASKGRLHGRALCKLQLQILYRLDRGTMVLGKVDEPITLLRFCPLTALSNHVLPRTSRCTCTPYRSALSPNALSSKMSTRPNSGRTASGPTMKLQTFTPTVNQSRYLKPLLLNPEYAARYAQCLTDI